MIFLTEFNKFILKIPWDEYLFGKNKNPLEPKCTRITETILKKNNCRRFALSDNQNIPQRCSN